MLVPGARFGSYEVVALQGTGGMGEVYRARDTRLNRVVALKCLPESFAADPGRVVRFDREAQVLASLNHAGIATLHGVEEEKGTRALVMELVEGPTLAERIARGPLPIDDALRIANQMAEALEYAHDKGVVHRDLKPDNVKLTANDSVKILDFGLAKALVADSPPPDAHESLTVIAHATEAGTILGTLPYMSPEQARGESVDKRTDIWAFGAILGEMLTGERVFDGATPSDTIASVLRSEPNLDRLPADTPPAIRRILRRCLEKNPRLRMRDIGDVRNEIADVLGSPPDVVSPVAPRRHRRMVLLWCLAGVVMGAAAASVILWTLMADKPRLGMRFNVVTNFAGEETSPSLSPDARSVVLVSDRDGQHDLYVALVSGGSLVRITNDPNVETKPRWSPDGAQIVYARLNEWGQWDLWVIPALGGTPRKLVASATEPAWSPDGTSLCYSDLLTGTVFLSNSAGNNARPITKPERSLHRQPAFSPDGRRVTFVRRSSGPRGELAVVEIASGDVRQLTNDGALAASPVWSSDNLIYFASTRGGTTNIWRTKPDGSHLEQVTAGQGDDVDVDVSADGRRLVFSTVRLDQNLAEVMLDVPGKVRQLTADVARAENMPSYSPDGTSIAYFSSRKGAENESIWVMNADGSNPVQLVLDDMINVFPKWTADGKQIIYASRPLGLYSGSEFRRISASGGRPETIGRYELASPARSQGPRIDVAPDQRLVFSDGNIRILDPASGETRTLDVKGLEPKWSPSGERICYRMDARAAGDENTGLWLYDFTNPPRQLYRGWVVRYSWVSEDELIVVAGSADLKSPVWRVYTDGRPQSRTQAGLRISQSYTYMTLTGVEIDAHPDGRRIVLSAYLSDGDIGMIDNIR